MWCLHKKLQLLHNQCEGYHQEFTRSVKKRYRRDVIRGHVLCIDKAGCGPNKVKHCEECMLQTHSLNLSSLFRCRIPSPDLPSMRQWGTCWAAQARGPCPFTRRSCWELLEVNTHSHVSFSTQSIMNRPTVITSLKYLVESKPSPQH